MALVSDKPNMEVVAVMVFSLVSQYCLIGEKNRFVWNHGVYFVTMKTTILPQTIFYLISNENSKLRYFSKSRHIAATSQISFKMHTS